MGCCSKHGHIYIHIIYIYTVYKSHFIHLHVNDLLNSVLFSTLTPFYDFLADSNGGNTYVP